MQAKIEKDGDVLIIHLEGHLNYDSNEPFRKTCLTHLIHERVVFNFNELSFVGSNGITDFVETMVDLSKENKVGVRLCRLSTEFRRIFEASGFQNLQIFEDVVGARRSFQQPQAIMEATAVQSVASDVPEPGGVPLSPSAAPPLAPEVVEVTPVIKSNRIDYTDSDEELP